MGTSEDRDRIRSRLDAIANRHAGEDRIAEPMDQAATPDWLTEPEVPAHPGARWAPERLRSARVNPGRRGALALAVVGLVAAVIAGMSVLRDRPVAQAVPPLPVVHTELTGGSQAAQPSVTAPPPGAVPQELVVSVVGLVNKGGLVRLPPGSRVADALAAAGGGKEGADLLSLNMAQRVSDGDQILVGVAGSDGGPPLLGSATIGAGAAKAAPPKGSGGAAPGGKVSLNSATEQELDALPGVGPVTAGAIVSWRTTNGKFTDVEQLGEVDGIGPGRLAKLRDLVTL